MVLYNPNYYQADRLDFAQGPLSSCQTLAVINAMLQTQAGYGQLRNMIQGRPEGGYVVEFPRHAPVIVTPRDLQDPNLSDGSLMVGILERAALELHARDNTVHEPMSLLTGHHHNTLFLPLGHPDVKEMSHHVIEQARSNPDIILMAGTYGRGDDTITFTAQSVYGPVQIHESHAYSVIAHSSGHLILENPHDTRDHQRIVMTQAQFDRAFGILQAATISGEDIAFPKHFADLSRHAKLLAHHAYESWGMEYGNYSAAGFAVRTEPTESMALPGEIQVTQSAPVPPVPARRPEIPARQNSVTHSRGSADTASEYPTTLSGLEHIQQVMHRGGLVRRGQRGEAVKQLQGFLLQQGYDIGSTGVDGVFGTQTQHAVRQFQADYGLDVDGVVGKQTLEKIVEVQQSQSLQRAQAQARKSIEENTQVTLSDPDSMAPSPAIARNAPNQPVRAS